MTTEKYSLHSFVTFMYKCNLNGPEKPGKLRLPQCVHVIAFMLQMSDTQI